MAGTEVYQGWVIKNNHLDGIGLLNVRDRVATLDFPSDIRVYDAVAVSREPGPQASQGKPHGQMVALGTLQNKRGLMGTGSWLTMRMMRLSKRELSRSQQREPAVNGEELSDKMLISAIANMAVFQGWTHSEIAEGSRLPRGTVKARMPLGLLHLKRYLEKKDICPSEQ